MFRTGEHVWPCVVYLAMPTMNAALRVHSVEFTFDWQSQSKVDAKFVRLRRTVPAECVQFTYTGLFDTREDWSKAKLRYPNGIWKYAGFGHLGEAPAQLILKSVDDVAVIPGCRDVNAGGKK